MTRVPNLTDFPAVESIFVDANVFLFHAFDDPDYGDAATRFLTEIEKGNIQAVTSALVVDEVFYKILVQEAAAHLRRPTVWNIKRAMRRQTFREAVYRPVALYRAYLEALIQLGLRIFKVTNVDLFAASEIGRQEGLVITDAAHIAVMRRNGIAHIATDDADLFRIQGIRAWRPS